MLAHRSRLVTRITISSQQLAHYSTEATTIGNKGRYNKPQWRTNKTTAREKLVKKYIREQSKKVHEMQKHDKVATQTKVQPTTDQPTTLSNLEMFRTRDINDCYNYFLEQAQKTEDVDQAFDMSTRMITGEAMEAKSLAPLSRQVIGLLCRGLLLDIKAQSFNDAVLDFQTLIDTLEKSANIPEALLGMSYACKGFALHHLLQRDTNNVELRTQYEHVLDIAIQHAPDLIKARFHRIIAVNRKNADQSIKDCDHIIKIAKKDKYWSSLAYYHRGVIRLASKVSNKKLENETADTATEIVKNAYKDSLRDFMDALRLNPNMGDAYREASSLFVTMHDYTNGVKYQTEYIELLKREEQPIATALFSRAMIHLKVGDQDSGYTDLNEAFKLEPQLVGIYAKMVQFEE
jgi:tetratricopeptide (TPR) repeat protein